MHLRPECAQERDRRQAAGDMLDEVPPHSLPSISLAHASRFAAMRRRRRAGGGVYGELYHQER